MLVLAWYKEIYDNCENKDLLLYPVCDNLLNHVKKNPNNNSKSDKANLRERFLGKQFDVLLT